jgi:hypothetical protein
MEHFRNLALASAAALLLFGGSAIAQDVVDPDMTDDTTDTSTTGPTEDETGFAVFGVDISAAGSSTASVQTFVAGLSAEQQTAINATCENRVSETDASPVHQNVTSFCELLLGT